jgi:hypothetical protein
VKKEVVVQKESIDAWCKERKQPAKVDALQQMIVTLKRYETQPNTIFHILLTIPGRFLSPYRFTRSNFSLKTTCMSLSLFIWKSLVLNNNRVK